MHALSISSFRKRHSPGVEEEHESEPEDGAAAAAAGGSVYSCSSADAVSLATPTGDFDAPFREGRASDWLSSSSSGHAAARETDDDNCDGDGDGGVARGMSGDLRDELEVGNNREYHEKGPIRLFLFLCSEAYVQ